MPSQKTIEKFIARVEENEHDKAIEEFYTLNASMQENQSKARIGRDDLIKNEKEIMAMAKSIQSKCIGPVFKNGNYTVIRWNFQFEWLDGTKTEIEEIAYQRWSGEFIREEIFFYDPAQRIPK